MEKIELDFPLDIAGSKIAFVQMRRPKVSDMIVADKLGKKNDMETTVQLFALLTQQDPEVIREMDFKDFTKLKVAFENFTS